MGRRPAYFENRLRTQFHSEFFLHHNRSLMATLFIPKKESVTFHSARGWLTSHGLYISRPSWTHGLFHFTPPNELDSIGNKAGQSVHACHSHTDDDRCLSRQFYDETTKHRDDTPRQSHIRVHLHAPRRLHTQTTHVETITHQTNTLVRQMCRGVCICFDV